MKLNNKGFAITAVLYGLLILFVLLVGMYLLVLSAKKNRLDSIFSDLEKEYEINIQLDRFEFPLIIPEDGIYVFSLTDNIGNDLECTVRLADADVIEFNNNIKIDNNYVDFDEVNCDNINSSDNVLSVNKITYVES